MAISKFTVGITLASSLVLAGMIYGSLLVFGPHARAQRRHSTPDSTEAVAAPTQSDPLVRRTTHDASAKAPSGQGATVDVSASQAPGQIMDAKTFLDRQFSDHVTPEVKPRPDLQHTNREEYEREMQAQYPDLARNAAEDAQSELAKEQAQRDLDREEAERKRVMEQAERNKRAQ
jgi:hypothetical protein